MSDGPTNSHVPEPAERMPPPPGALVGIPLARPVIDRRPVEARYDRDPLLLREMPAWQAVVDLIAIVIWAVAVELLSARVITYAFGYELKAITNPDVQRRLLAPWITIRAAAITLGVGIILARRGQRPAHVGFTTRWLLPGIPLGLFTAVAMLIGGGVVVQVANLIWPGLDELFRANAENIGEILPPLSIPQLALLNVVVATYEELLLRGFVMPRLRRLTRSWTIAVVLSTALFAGLHLPDQNLAAVCALTVVSLVLSTLTIATRSLVPAIAAHFLFNFVQMVIIKLTFEAGS